MKKYLLVLVCIFSLVIFTQAQTFFELHNLSSKGMTVVVEETSSQVYLAPVGSTTAPSFSEQIFSALSLNQVTLRLSFDGKSRRVVLPIHNGRVSIFESDLGTRSNPIETSSSLVNSGGTTFVKKHSEDRKVTHESGRFVKVFNLTAYKLYGMTDEIKGYILDPGGITDSVEGNKNYIVSKNLGISYNPLLNQFLDRQGTVIKDSLLLSRILNSSMSSSAMINLWLPSKDLNWNLRYQDNIVLQGENVLLDLLVVVQRMVNLNTKVITITTDDLKDYRPHGKTTKRRIQNKTTQEFIFELAGKQLVVPPKKSRKMSLSDKFYLPEGAYYIPMSMIDKGKMYQFYYLTIFNNKTDIYPEINSWNLKGLRIFGQTSLD